jgi:hypothetical protein
VIQYTDYCNARCSQCGMSADNAFHRSKLDPPFVRRMLETAASQGVMSVSLTGGEPLLFADEVFELLGCAHELGIHLTRTGTNGFMFRAYEAADFSEKIAALASRLRDARVHTFWISLDSADPEMHERNRGLSGVVEGIRQALPVFHAHDIYPAANLGLNRAMGWTIVDPLSDPGVFAAQARDALRDFYRAAIDMGFTMANVCYPMSLDNTDEAAAYRATSTAGLVEFTQTERDILFRVLAEVTREFRPYIRIFTPLCSLEALSGREGSPGRVAACRGGVDFFYVAASDRALYPCGFRGTEPLGDPTNPATWRTRSRAQCRRCDWECFRDPSQMLAPFTGLLRHPYRPLRWTLTDPRGVRTWHDDLRYYSACGYFAAFRAPQPERLARFSRFFPFC